MPSEITLSGCISNICPIVLFIDLLAGGSMEKISAKNSEKREDLRINKVFVRVFDNFISEKKGLM